MKAEWQRWSAQFSARPLRERRILAIAALAVTYALVDAIWLSPALARWQIERKALVQKTADLAKVSGQLSQLVEQMRKQDAQTKAALDAGRRELGTISLQLAEMEKTLVPARHMTALLQGLLPGRGVEIIGIRTLPPTPLLERPAKPAEVAKPAAGGQLPVEARTPQAAKPADPPVPAADTGQANLYRHGVEIRLAGSYAALVDYLDRLEKSPQKVIFGRMDLSAEQHPRSVLTLTIYTLSLDRSWLIV